jgi:hypothetical protein
MASLESASVVAHHAAVSASIAPRALAQPQRANAAHAPAKLRPPAIGLIPTLAMCHAGFAGDVKWHSQRLRAPAPRWGLIGFARADPIVCIRSMSNSNQNDRPA